jgi:hypothetical protein
MNICLANGLKQTFPEGKNWRKSSELEVALEKLSFSLPGKFVLDHLPNKCSSMIIGGG